MNITTNGKKHRGSVLLVALLTAWVIGIALVSYLTLVASQNRSTYHSQTWNACIPVLEAGIEEALNHIHYAVIPANLGANQWTYDAADGQYHKNRMLTNSGASYYEVGIAPIDPRGDPHGPVIVCSGYVVAPANTGTPMGGQSAFGMILGTVSGILSPSTPSYIFRTVRVTTRHRPPGDGGINANGKIVISGGAFFDSFDSSNPNYNDGSGGYSAAKHSANAKALTNLGTADAINVGGGTIFGSVTTGANGDVTIGDGSVGDLGWAASQPGIQRAPTDHQSDDANVQFDNVLPPFVYGTGSTPGIGISSVLTGVPTTYAWLLDSGNYQSGSVNLSGGRTMLVTGNATLYVNGNFGTAGGGGIIIAPGASLKLYIAGTASFTGNGIVNKSGRARNLTIFGLNSSTTFGYSGTSEFIGTVYAPHAAIKFSGGAQAFGAFTGNTVTLDGGAHVAYDEDLKNTGPYVMDSWNEI